MLAGVLLTAACGATLTPSAGDVAPAVDDVGPVVRVALTTTTSARISASGAWRMYDTGGESTLLRAASGEVWTVQAQRADAYLRAVRADGVPTERRPGPFVARPLSHGALLILDGKAYRGELALIPTDSGMLIVNRLSLEDYLRGVLPREAGSRTVAERAAIEAIAVAARSYARVRISGDAMRPYDIRATDLDQVYGGAAVETALTDQAIAATEGLVIKFGGRVVGAPYHSTCGGSTAAANEIWQRSSDEPYLRAVSDRIPGTDRYYCENSPRFRWQTTLDRATLAVNLGRYLRAYAVVPGGAPGTARSVVTDGTTSSGRVRSLVITTDRGPFTLRGNDIRFVMRAPGGAILNSTYFTVVSERAADGAVARLTFRGSGWGHGVGMCQWGAFGRARAGQDFRSILQTYYPGTTVEPLD
ncbi:MAG TPA: SpoIID/LytB domain-containing protein [Gemmatimonadaceae bacterium]|nr:SpoIID/LytB domain-containing protein [Gemmatimonadaceae bacterium]